MAQDNCTSDSDNDNGTDNNHAGLSHNGDAPRAHSPIQKREEDAREVLIVSLIERLEEMERQLGQNKIHSNSMIVGMLEYIVDTVVNFLHPKVGIILFPFVFCLWTVCVLVRTLKRMLYL